MRAKAQSAEQDLSAVHRFLSAGGGHVHLLGIGGVGMAGLARLLAGRNIRVSGCDLSRNRLTDWLSGQRVEVRLGHDPAHLAPDVTWAVRSTAVPRGSAELLEAERRGIPVFMRGAVLAALLEGTTSVAVSGTHGKTTTAAMIAECLAACGRLPSFCIGGELDVLGGVAGVGTGPFVVEADESDGTVALYSADIAVVTNIEFDHMEHFRDRNEVEACFVAFAAKARQRVIFSADDPAAARVCGRVRLGLSCGLAESARVRGVIQSLGPAASDLEVHVEGRRLGVIRVAVPGRHNVLNALAACAACMELGCSFEEVASALGRFKPARRRLETVVDAGGIKVVSDYAHHPTEIRAVVEVAKTWPHKRLVAVFQPHRYTRTRALGAEFPPAFEGVDRLVLVPVYAASEAPLEGGMGKDLAGRFRADGRVPVSYAASLREAWDQLRCAIQKGDVLLVLGAGDIEAIAGWAREEWGSSQDI